MAKPKKECLLFVLFYCMQFLVCFGAANTVSSFLMQKTNFVREFTRNLTQKDSLLSLLQPPLSYECTNVLPEQVKFITTVPNQLYMLTKNELFYIKISQRRAVRINFVGTLYGATENLQRALIIHFKDLRVIGVQEEGKDIINIYLADRMEQMPVEMVSIQSLEFKGLVSFEFLLVNETLIMIVLVEKEDDPNKIILLTWHKSFFTLEDQLLLELPDNNKMEVFRGDHPLILTTGFDIEANKKVLLVLSVEKTSEGKHKLKQQQKMFFVHSHVEQYSSDGGLYLMGCSSESFCSIYHWSGKEFQRHQMLNTQVAHRIQRIDSQNNLTLVTVENDQLQLFLGHDLSGTYLNITQDVNTLDYGLIRGLDEANYYMEIMKYKTWLKINFYQIKDLNTDVLKQIQLDFKQEHRQDPVACIKHLKELLKARKPSLDVIKAQTEPLKNSTRPSLNDKKHISTNALLLKNVTVHSVQMPYNVTVGGSELLDRVMQVNIFRGLLVQRLQKYEHVHQSWNQKGVNFVDIQLGAPPQPPTVIDTIVVKRLIYRGSQVKENIFGDIMIRSQPQLLGDISEMNIESLKTGKLLLDKNKVNGILLSDVVTVEQNIPIMGQKSFEELIVNETTLQTLNGVDFNEFLEKVKRQDSEYEHLDMVGDIFVNELNVREINGIGWSDFMKSCYRSGKRSTLIGNLVLLNTSHVTNLTTDFLQGVPTELLMTTSTDQKIYADIFMNKFKGHSISAGRINGGSLEQIALLGQVNEIRSPIKILTIHIDGGLTIEPQDDNRSFPQTMEAIKRHIIGTRSTDLTQIYSGQVRILGSLTLKNVVVEQDGKLMLGDQPLNAKISDTYWLKHKNQEIPTTFKFNNKVDAVQVTSKLLNNHSALNLLLLEPPPNWIQAPINLRFSSATSSQNVVARKSRLNVLNDLAVRRGEVALIKGAIEFRDEVIVQDLNTRILNGVPTVGLVHPQMREIQFTSPITLNKLELNGQALSVDQSLVITNYNGVHLNKFFEQVIRLDQPFFLNKMQVDNFSSNNLTVRLFENHQFDLLFQQLQQQFVDHPEGQEQTSTNEKNLRIRGDASFTTEIQVNYFNNDLNVDDHLGLIVDPLSQEELLEIGGEKLFQESMVVNQNLDARYLNDIELNKWLHNSLLRTGKQIIRGKWHIQRAKAKHWRAKSWKHKLVDKTDGNYQMHSNLEVKELVVENMMASTELDITGLMHLVDAPKSTIWGNMIVHGDAKIPIGSTTVLDELVSFGVCRGCGKQKILEEVIVLEDASVEVIQKTDNVVLAQREAVDVQVMMVDSLKRRSDKPQVVLGKKSFANPLYMKNMVVAEEASLNAVKINDIDILQLNQSLFRIHLGEVLSGQKVFQKPVQVQHLTTKHLISGIPFESLIFVTPKDFRLNRLVCRHLSFKNLQVSMLNQYSLNYLLLNRMRKKGVPQDVHGQLTFDHLEFVDDATITSINGLQINDIVFLKSHKAQDIEGHKHFTGNLTLIGPSTIQIINEYDVLELYKETIFRDMNQYIDFMQFPALNLKKGLLLQHLINQRHIHDLMNPPRAGLGWIELVPQIKELVAKMRVKLNQKPTEKRFLYIDHSPNLQIVPDSKEIPSDCYTNDDLVITPHHNQVLVKHNYKRNMDYVIENLSINFTVTTNIAEAQCHPEIINNQLSVLWTSMEGGYFFQNFTYGALHLEDVQVIEPPLSTGIFMILVQKNREKAEHIVAIQMLNKATNEWHESLKIEGLGNFTVVNLVYTDKYQLLIVSASKHCIIYMFNVNQFKEIQKIQQHFDLIVDVQVEHNRRIGASKTMFLLMTSKGAKKLVVYKYSDQIILGRTPKLVIYQEIVFDSPINGIKKITIEGSPYFIVSFEDGYFMMYRWLGIEGWQQKQRGYFSHISRIQSYEYLSRQYIFLSSRLNIATALTVYKQGELVNY